MIRKKQVGHKTAKNIMSAVLTALMAMSSAGSVTAVNFANVSAKTTVKKTTKKSTKKSAPKVYITPTSKTIYTKSSTYVYLKNNKGTVKWSASNTKVTLSKKTKGSVKLYGKSAGTSYVTAKVGRKKYTTKVTVKNPVKKVPTVYITPTSKTIYTKSSTYVYLKNNKSNVTWTASNSKISLSKKSKTSVKVYGKSAGTSYVTAMAGKTKYSCKISIKNKANQNDSDTKNNTNKNSSTNNDKKDNSSTNINENNKYNYSMSVLHGISKYDDGNIYASTPEEYKNGGAMTGTCTTVYIHVVTNDPNYIDDIEDSENRYLTTDDIHADLNKKVSDGYVVPIVFYKTGTQTIKLMNGYDTLATLTIDNVKSPVEFENACREEYWTNSKASSKTTTEEKIATFAKYVRDNTKYFDKISNNNFDTLAVNSGCWWQNKQFNCNSISYLFVNTLLNHKTELGIKTISSNVQSSGHITYLVTYTENGKTYTKEFDPSPYGVYANVWDGTMVN